MAGTCGGKGHGIMHLAWGFFFRRFLEDVFEAMIFWIMFFLFCVALPFSLNIAN